MDKDDIKVMTSLKGAIDKSIKGFGLEINFKEYEFKVETSMFSPEMIQLTMHSKAFPSSENLILIFERIDEKTVIFKLESDSNGEEVLPSDLQKIVMRIENIIDEFVNRSIDSQNKVNQRVSNHR